jgi:hypothetical protein
VRPLLVVLAVLALGACGSNDTPDATPPEPTTAAQQVAPTPTLAGEECSRRADRPFVPTSIAVIGVTQPVLGLPRDADNIPGVPSLTSADKLVFAWDKPGVKPGAKQGNVLLNTHTWPDGSAMGNRLLRDLDEGERFVLEGAGSRLCYRVTERVEVSIENPPVERVYDTEGAPQAVIIVCSGTRLGPGEWTHRTLWFASPVS